MLGDRLPAFPPPGHSSSPTSIISGIAVLCDLPRSLDLSEHRVAERGEEDPLAGSSVPTDTSDLSGRPGQARP